MKPFHHPRVLRIFIVVLFVFLILTAVLVTYQQRDLLRSSVRARAVYDLDLMADASLEALLKSDYMTVRTFVERWGSSHEDILLIRITAPNGFVIAEYRNYPPSAGEAYTLSKEVMLEGAALATIHLAGDYREAEMLALRLRNRLILAAMIITVLLGTALWVTFRRMALVPLEKMVDERTSALSRANQELEQEIAERISAEKSLKKSEEQTTLILDSIAEGIYGIDFQGNCTFCNPAALRMLGLERPENVLGKDMHQLIHHTRHDGIPLHEEDCRVIRSFREGKNDHAHDEVFWRADGSSFPVEYWVQPIMRDGVPIGAVTAFVDITERKQTEDALKRSENLLKTIIDTEPDCVKMLDAQDNLIMMNRAGLDMLDADSLDQVKGQNVCPLVTSEYRQAFMDLTSRVFQGQSGTLAFEMVGLKGRHLWMETRAVPFRNDKNEIVALLGITRDITERQKLEEQLRQAKKMESIGTFAGGVAHDFNNILTAITGYGHLSLMKMAPDDPHQHNIQQILESAERAAHLTRDLLLFSRKQPIVRKPIDLNEGIQRLGKFLVRVIGEDIVFKTMLSGGTMPVLADSHHIDQVLMNLAVNARDAMPAGGAFTISTEQVLLDKAFTDAHWLGMPGKYALISVSDTGQGMNEETGRRIFEPFFTTKEVGKGTGLGLSVVYGIVKQHEGSIMVYSEPGHGTTFRIYLPIIETNAAKDEAPVEEEPPFGGTETILLAEDDKAVREMTRMLLQDSGYTVITAADGEDAVRRFTENKDKIHLLLFDLIMPKKTGKDAYDEIRKIRTDIKVIFASGYDPDLVRQKALIEQHIPVVYKPVPMTALLKKIRSVLDSDNAY